MAHVPFLHLPGPWSGEEIPLGRAQANHLGRVLRLRPGDAVEYTDGRGTRGAGSLSGAAVLRGREETRQRPPRLVVAVGPIRSKERLRFLVEKLTEVGATEVWWLRTKFVQAWPAGREKAETWAVAGLEQSRGAWLPTFRDAEWDDITASDLEAAVLDLSGERGDIAAPCLLVVGPEGGFADGEVPTSLRAVRLTDTVLRTETAAILGAGLARVHSAL